MDNFKPPSLEKLVPIGASAHCSNIDCADHVQEILEENAIMRKFILSNTTIEQRKELKWVSI